METTELKQPPKEVLLCKCRKCDYVWTPRVKDPKSCPECKSRNW